MFSDGVAVLYLLWVVYCRENLRAATRPWCHRLRHRVVAAVNRNQLLCTFNPAVDLHFNLELIFGVNRNTSWRCLVWSVLLAAQFWWKHWHTRRPWRGRQRFYFWLVSSTKWVYILVFHKIHDLFDTVCLWFISSLICMWLETLNSRCGSVVNAPPVFPHHITFP